MLAVDAVNAINENVNNDDAVKMLGHPLKIKAQRKNICISIISLIAQLQSAEFYEKSVEDKIR